jgi:hypothetical protein
MKKISLMLVIASLGLTTQFANAQDNDTSKNKIEVKKKVKTGVHGRQVTKIKVEGKGTPEAINSAAASAVTGKTRVVVAPTPAPTPPQVVVVNRNPDPKPATTTVVTKTETKPVVTTRQTTTTATRTSTAHVVHKTTPVKRPVRRVVYKKPAVAASTTTTTTTVKKEQ